MLLLAVCLLLAGCSPSVPSLQPPTETAAATATAAPLQQVDITLLAEPTVSPEPVTETPPPPPTPSLTPRTAAALGTPYPLPAVRIGIETASRVTALARWGMGELNHLTLSPDGQTLAAASATGLSLYAADTLAPVQSMDTGIGIHALAFSPDGRFLASDSQLGVLVWDTGTGQVVQEMGGERPRPGQCGFFFTRWPAPCRRQ